MLACLCVICVYVFLLVSVPDICLSSNICRRSNRQAAQHRRVSGKIYWPDAVRGCNGGKRI